MRISTRFTFGLDGWTVTNGTETREASGGNPGGNIRAVEGGSGVYAYEAPTKYLGDKSDFIGGTLSFDLKQDGDASPYDDSDVTLTGAGLTLVIDAGDNPGTDWTSYTVGLGLGAGWKVGSLGGRIATEDEILSVLSDLESLRIRGEFVNGSTDDASNLDNVVLTDSAPVAPVLQGPRVASTFDTDTEGWSFIADVKEFRQVPTGGNPGGYLEAVDYTTGAVWYYAAPLAFLGSKGAFSRGTLSFDLKQSSLSSQFNSDDIRLVGSEKTLALDLPMNPGLDWTSYSVTLDTATDWRLGSSSGEVASQSDILDVLRDLQKLYIRGEYVSGSDTGGLDNAVMQARDANVRVLADAVNGALKSSHDDMTSALSVVRNGNAILIEDAAGLTQSSYTLPRNNLTVISDFETDTVLRVGSQVSVALSGTNVMEVIGNANDNRISGSDGANRLNGKLGADMIAGGRGGDRIFGGNGDDDLSGDIGRDRLFGGNGRDTVTGGEGNDILFGGNAKDTLLGGQGNDTITGGGGNDRINGQRGGDTFVFNGDWGRDTVLAFEVDADELRIDPGNGEVSSRAAFGAASTQVGDNLVYDLDDDGVNVIVLRNIVFDDLTDANFNFG